MTQVSHDDKGVTSVSFVEGVDVRRPGRVSDLLARAMRQRAVGATASNEHSSRSHMVFTLTISGTNASSGQQITGEALSKFYALLLNTVRGSLQLQKCSDSPAHLSGKLEGLSRMLLVVAYRYLEAHSAQASQAFAAGIRQS